MIITAAFLAEAAAIVDSKLHLWGGLFTRYTVGPDRNARMTLVLFTQGERGNDDPAVTVKVTPPVGGQPVQLEFAVPESTAAAELGFAFQTIWINFPFDGRWVITVQSGSGREPVAIPLTVDTGHVPVLTEAPPSN